MNRRNKKEASKAQVSRKQEKPLKMVYVIMPFQRTPTRDEDRLTSFFVNNLKRPIEVARLNNRYQVRRSDETFNITKQIIKDLYAADIVIADLSGENSNPNVMYELGMRLAFSNGPVILIREKHADNRPIFDVGGLYAEPYDPFNYTDITAHVIDKIRRFETGVENYRSPVLEVLGEDEPLLLQLTKRRASKLLFSLVGSLTSTLRLFAGIVSEYVSNRSDLKLAGDVTEFVKQLTLNREALQRIDWSEFKFRLGAQPAVDYYIASPYLTGLVDEEIERDFSGAMFSYYANFICGDSYWQMLDNFAMILLFADETETLTLIATMLGGLMLSTEPDLKEQAVVALQGLHSLRNIS